MPWNQKLSGETHRPTESMYIQQSRVSAFETILGSRLRIFWNWTSADRTLNSTAQGVIEFPSNWRKIDPKEKRLYNHLSLVPRDRLRGRTAAAMATHNKEKPIRCLCRKPAVQFLVSTSSDFGKQIKVSLRNAGAGDANAQPSVTWKK